MRNVQASQQAKPSRRPTLRPILPSSPSPLGCPRTAPSLERVTSSSDDAPTLVGFGARTRVGVALLPQTHHLEDDEPTKSYPVEATRMRTSSKLARFGWFALGVMFGIALAAFTRRMQSTHTSEVGSPSPAQTTMLSTAPAPAPSVVVVAPPVDDASATAVEMPVAPPPPATPRANTPRHRVASKPKPPKPIAIHGAEDTR
ncbi:MAG: hypothetical protein FWD69_09015 [Polyangiaceae bacterium]|nr:hypothetical protein [Polyangiaceae bacterium]